MAVLDLESAVILVDEVIVTEDPVLLEPLMRFTLEEEAVTGRWTVTIALCNDATLRRLHREFMGQDSETDVMTFPLAVATPVEHGGDIAISVERAMDQAPDWGHTPWQEIRYLAVHGLLHLCGWVDERPADRERMLARQREIIDRFDQHDAMLIEEA